RELLGQHYSETHYSADGTEIMEKPKVEDHCFYQGHVEGHTDSAASISTCGGLSGFFQVNESTFLLEPLEESASGQHAVYRATHLRGKRGTCQESSATQEFDHETKIPAAMKLYHWKSAPLREGPRYVELVLVVDNKEFRKHKDLHTVQNRMKEIVNHVDKLYQPLHLRVALIGLEVWTHKDKIVVSPNPEVTLDNFLRWREAELLQRKPHDNAQLITGIDFHGTTVGLAKKLAMCTRDSGGVNQDHSVNPVGAASTMAHEMGHNLGMSHDDDVAGCRCPVPKADGGCVMAASVGLVYPKLFSRCSEQDMWQFLGDPRTSCLLNIPQADELYGGPVCGNQFVERGEQCDCGTPEVCSDRCCNATTCQLREAAECAQGACCQDCKVKATGALCRASKSDCDLPEYCSGFSAECPEDVFQENGISCLNGNGYCYNGACPSHGEQCRTLWGAGSISPTLPILLAPHFGDVKCGTLLCLSNNAYPVLGDGSLSVGHFKCKAVITNNDANEVLAKLSLVPTGAKCGEEMVCYAGRCQNLLVYGNKNCSAKCNHHGVCNHKRECHCDPGWAAPYCEHKISEVVAGSSSMVLVAVLAMLALSGILLGVGVVIFRGQGMRCFQKGRISNGPTAGLSSLLFQEGIQARFHCCQPSRHDIGHPKMLSSRAASRDIWPLTPCRPALQVREQIKAPVQGSPCLCLKISPPDSGLSSYQVKPKPPSKPLPALKSKVLCPGERPPGKVLPCSPPTPASVCQRSVPSKVALKPPVARR
ncbi:ADAM8 protein, partial [Brachypteracias leptosomus]|nr:ADAM8 protein [Brachypteracias leptosomus]